MFNPRYTITPKILSNITDLVEIKAIIERSRVLPLNEAQLRREALLKMAHTSTSIEGNKLAQFEVGKVLEGKVINAPQKDILEVENYYQALQLLDKLAKNDTTISADEILKLHKILTANLIESDKSGQFRPSDVYIIDDLGGGKERLRFKAPDAKDLQKLVAELLDWLKNSKDEGIHPIIQAGILHLQFVTIHPFTDGNGRMTRLLTQLQLYRAGWDFRKIIVLDDYYNRDRMSYYDAEHKVQGSAYNKEADFTSWLEYFTTGFLIEAQKVLEQIQSIGFGQASDQSDQIFLDHNDIQIMDFITTTGRITSEDVTDILKIARRTAQLKLKNLVEKDLLIRHGNTSSIYYTLKK